MSRVLPRSKTRHVSNDKRFTIAEHNPNRSKRRGLRQVLDLIGNHLMKAHGLITDSRGTLKVALPNPSCAVPQA